jgi:hypothetical protein
VIIPPILICERRLGDPRVTFIPTQSIYERAPGVRDGNATAQLGKKKNIIDSIICIQICRFAPLPDGLMVLNINIF